MNNWKLVLIVLKYLLTIACPVYARDKLVGLHSSELLSGHLVVPRKVNENGEFLSYNLTHHHREHYEHQRHRRAVDNPHFLYRNEDLVHYQLHIDGETLHLELLPHNYFLTPHLLVERHKREILSRNKPKTATTSCHYQGRVRGYQLSNVAISACKGLVGHIKTKRHEYYIEPSKHHSNHAADGYPHVVFQRSGLKANKRNTNNNRKRRTKYRKLQNSLLRIQSRKDIRQQDVSNCGTKEPKTQLQNRIVEWQSLGKIKIQSNRKLRRRSNYPRRKHKRQQRQQQRRLFDNDMDPSTSVSTEQPKELDLNNSRQQHRQVSSRAMPPQPLQIQNKRQRRSISSPRHVETLIVADQTMVAFHEDVETYLLTIMNMVSALYKDPSIGNAIEIVVVKILLLEDDATHIDLNLTQNAQQNLDIFCSWQHKLNTGNDFDPHHHDVAILITRKNICGNNCMTLGLANVGGMCKPKKSCSVNEDNGIMLSHTIAHELGHNFGMFHDSAKIGCHPRVGSVVHIMTPTFGADTLQVSWSNCSRKFITHFLDQGFGECLDDAPMSYDKYTYPDRQPGLLYNAEVQCRLQYNVTDSEVEACSSMNEICSMLWCRVNGECVTNMRPTAPGTICGKRKWCQNGQCVHMEELITVNGGWGNWTEWTECSRSCGGGVSIQQRECDNPLPSNGGVFCIGERKRYKICNVNSCPKTYNSFRAQQCEEYNTIPYQGEFYKWLPYFNKEHPCQLYCTDADETIIANWGDTVVDGTPCSLGTNNLCIDGICKKVGCDWQLDSDMLEDSCGVCGGNDDQCHSVEGVFNETLKIHEGYMEILVLPAKARRILIREMASMPHFLAIAKANSSQFYLNGNGLISMPEELIIAGAESSYDRDDDLETIEIPKAIEYSIAVYMIVRGKEPNIGIYYKFTLPALNVTSSKQLRWQLSKWTACSESCGGGLQYREPLCYHNGQETSESELCWAFAGNQHPKRLVRKCNEFSCPKNWWTDSWQLCPATCRKANETLPIRRRSVSCLDKNQIVVNESECDADTRPPDSEFCGHNLPECANFDI